MGITLVLFILLVTAVRIFGDCLNSPVERAADSIGFDIVNTSRFPLFISLLSGIAPPSPSGNLAPGSSHHFELQIIFLEDTSADVGYQSIGASVSFTLRNRAFPTYRNPSITDINMSGPITTKSPSSKTLIIANA
ncbi:hypothetical protein M3223_23170 [Paenibacillus pasadenensis]|uniref:hypothetical protein n=1 Tax=Paenibacillus pasadenensis TaxID=217090 RepID=UPI00203D917B|nr:hypothetical protein [Paenibacillus pasadenensis]MCM3750242.1 hypothetical protein [Paenibacillus pasadenensis]